MSARPAMAGAWLRPLRADDLDAVMAIEQRAYEFPWTRGHFEDSLRAGHLLHLVEDGGQPVAYSVAMAGHLELHLLNLTVDPAHQGRGHARALLAALGVLGRELEAETLWLEVRVSNARARRLYESQGYSVRGRRPRYYPAADGQREDALLMARALS